MLRGIVLRLRLRGMALRLRGILPFFFLLRLRGIGVLRLGGES